MTSSKPYSVTEIDRQTSPIVLASPHSGNCYNEDFIAKSRLTLAELRRGEDAFIDDLFEPAKGIGIPLIAAHFPRVFVDANRSPWELDPDMFVGPLPNFVTTQSSRITAGLGTVAKFAAGNRQIYRHKLNFSDIQKRIKNTHVPYHEQLKELVHKTHRKFQQCLLIDCHSMPSGAELGNYHDKGLSDFILGDRFGSSCNDHITRLVETTLMDLGYSVGRNKPYAGGYTTRHYADINLGVETLQIEINRRLYMDEQTIERHQGFHQMQTDLGYLLRVLQNHTNEQTLKKQPTFAKAAE